MNMDKKLLNMSKTIDMKSISKGSIDSTNINSFETCKHYELNLNKIESLDDCKKILKFLSDRIVKPLPNGVEYNGFDEVKKYYD